MDENEKMAIAVKFFELAFPEDRALPEDVEKVRQIFKDQGWRFNVYRSETADWMIVEFWQEESHLGEKELIQEPFFVLYGGYDAANLTILNMGVSKAL